MTPTETITPPAADSLAANVEYCYRELGWSFTPLNGKRPTLKAWQNRPRETLDEATAWAARQNVGLRTGAASGGYMVIDVDAGGDISPLGLPATVTARTGRDGLHLIFHCARPLGNSAGKLGPHIDVKADGGQVVFVGSIHPDTGNRYEWVESLEPWNTEIAELPEHIYERLAKPKAAAPPKGPRTSNMTEAKYVSMALKLECERVATAPSGTRNDTLNKAAFNLGTLVGGGYLTASDIIEKLLVSADACGLIADDGLETCRNTVQSGVDAGSQHPRHVELRSDILTPPDDITVPDLPARRFGLDLYGLADRFMFLFGENVRWSEDRGQWLVWTGQVWTHDATRRVAHLGELTIRALLKEAAETNDEFTLKFAVKANMAARPRAEMLEVVKHHTAVSIAQFDTNPWLLCVENGVVDLKTGKLLPHEREQMITMICPTTFAPDATCPRWEQFLAEIMDGDKDMIDCLQRMAGYFLTGDISVQILPIFFGPGGNGKNVFLDTLMGVMGPFAAEAPEGLVTARMTDEHPTEIADLAGKRLVVASETEEGRKMRIGLVKKLTGNKFLKARFMRQDYFQFERSHKTVLVTNNRPIVAEVSHAIWRRLRLIPFEVTIPEARQDRHLTEKLMAEWPGILAWAVRGCLDWQQRGCDLALPDSVRRATADYRNDSDPVGQFIEERCVRLDGVKVSRTSLYLAYEQWARQAGEPMLAGKTFTSRMRSMGFDEQWTLESGKRTRAWGGVALAGPAEEVPGQWD